LIIRATDQGIDREQRRKRLGPHASTPTPMQDRFLSACPYCGEQVEIYVEPDVKGTFIQDCEICCRPWRVRVSGRGDRRTIDVARADGSE
jgi:hypothetical protein